MRTVDCDRIIVLSFVLYMYCPLYVKHILHARTQVHATRYMPPYDKYCEHFSGGGIRKRLVVPSHGSQRSSWRGPVLHLFRMCTVAAWHEHVQVSSRIHLLLQGFPDAHVCGACRPSTAATSKADYASTHGIWAGLLKHMAFEQGF